MKISVLMSVLNAGKNTYLTEALDCIYSQTFKDFEVIICNDGSSDHTQEILKDYAIGRPNFKIITNDTNQGLAFSLNKCLELAEGEYAARMDADDLIPEDRFQLQNDFLDLNKDFAFVSTNAKLYDDHGFWGEVKLPSFPTKDDLLFQSPFVHAATLFRTDMLKSVGGYRVAKETRRAEDYDLWFKFYKAGLKGANMDYFGYYIREDAEALRRRKFKFRIDEAVVRFKGYKSLNMSLKGFPYVLKPIFVGLIPKKILTKLKQKRAKRLDI